MTALLWYKSGVTNLFLRRAKFEIGAFWHRGPTFLEEFLDFRVVEKLKNR